MLWILYLARCLFHYLFRGFLLFFFLFQGQQSLYLLWVNFLCLYEFRWKSPVVVLKEYSFVGESLCRCAQRPWQESWIWCGHKLGPRSGCAGSSGLEGGGTGDGSVEPGVGPPSPPLSDPRQPTGREVWSQVAAAESWGWAWAGSLPFKDGFSPFSALEPHAPEWAALKQMGHRGGLYAPVCFRQRPKLSVLCWVCTHNCFPHCSDTASGANAFVAHSWSLLPASATLALG